MITLALVAVAALNLTVTCMKGLVLGVLYVYMINTNYSTVNEWRQYPT